MLEKAKLPEDVIAEAIQSNYGFDVSNVAFLPIGNDASAWTYRVTGSAGRFFLKLRKGVLNQAGLLLPRHLQEQGIESAVAPIATLIKEPYLALDDYALVLFPWIEGTSGWNRELTLQQYHGWGLIMRTIHSTALSAELAGILPREQFGKKWLVSLQKIEQFVEQGNFERAIARRMAQTWQANAADIDLARRRYLECAERLAAREPNMVLCHADIHPANIMVDKSETIRIVDWDEAIIAPKERDLMFFIRDGQSEQETAAFLRGYGGCTVESVGLAYYRYDWVMQEFCDYGERVFFATELGNADLEFAFDEFCRLFAEDDVLARAHQAYADIG